MLVTNHDIFLHIIIINCLYYLKQTIEVIGKEIIIKNYISIIAILNIRILKYLIYDITM